MDETTLTRVRIVLVEPAGARNVGAVARVMKNMGLRQLVLVNPQCDRLCEEAVHMAVHAVDVLEQAQVVATMPEALSGCTRAIATTARVRSIETNLENPRTALPWLIAPVPSALIFGPEDRGLSNAELNYAQRFVRIATNPEYPSLNLAAAVGICCYELYSSAISELSSFQVELSDFNNLTTFQSDNIETPTETAPLELLEGYYQQMEAVLLKMGYLYPHTATSRMEKFRRIFNRGNLSKEEVAMLRGIFSQMDWALQFLPESAKRDRKQ
ncbi:RNA methyltransferase [Trichocoleus sp. FACHB-90]|uniref:RNA methyltransferase n=1 Tax=Cyanophyceae TaxID=3028117 RepID=UPI001683F67A|nr:RNA methyltransferase [Trichocoleus sp. FACHB-90]MBD1929654.1 RNA methyltransferase [Trichocoleus sp. FACHB-90]